jgi:glycerol-3-phosphate dehydrogenase
MAFLRFAPYAGYLAVGAGGLQLLQQTVGFTSSGDDERRLFLANRVPSRSQQLSRLRQFTRDAPCDVLIIGGGATGAGCALDATSR